MHMFLEQIRTIFMGLCAEDEQGIVIDDKVFGQQMLSLGHYSTGRSALWYKFHVMDTK